MSGGYQRSFAYVRQLGGLVCVYRSGGDLEHALAGQYQPVPRRQLSGRVDAELATAKPATVAISTLCAAEGSQVTEISPASPVRPRQLPFQQQADPRTAARSGSSTSSVSRQPQSWSRRSRRRRRGRQIPNRADRPRTPARASPAPAAVPQRRHGNPGPVRLPARRAQSQDPANRTRLVQPVIFSVTRCRCLSLMPISRLRTQTMASSLLPQTTAGRTGQMTGMRRRKVNLPLVVVISCESTGTPNRRETVDLLPARLPRFRRGTGVGLGASGSRPDLRIG